MIDKRLHRGMVNINVRKNGKIINAVCMKNRITDEALDEFINILDGIAPDLELKYIAIGTDNSALSDTDTELGAEIFRAAVDTSDNSDTGTFETTFTIFEAEAVDQWEEIGFFCGAAATSTADTGTLLSRILYSRDKSSLEAIDITRTDLISRG